MGKPFSAKRFPHSLLLNGCRPFLAGLVLISGLGCPIPTSATWSIVAVDTDTREVGLAAATCTPSVQFVAAVVPGAGVVAAQAGTSFKGRDRARDWIAEGIGATEILRRLSDHAFYDGWFDTKFPHLQYGVATLEETPQAGFASGDELVPWFGGTSEVTYSVQGNSLRGKKVIASTARAFEIRADGTCRLTLAERLLRALEAGRDAGGDKRCPPHAPALSAMLVVAGDETGGHADLVRLVAPREISLLRAAYYTVFPAAGEIPSPEPVRQLRDKLRGLGLESCRS